MDPSKFTRYSHHFLIFYSTIFVSAIIRCFDYFLTDQKSWFISSTIEKSFACIDLTLCFILWIIIVTSPSELNQGELIDFEDDDDGVLVLFDGRVVRNVVKRLIYLYMHVTYHYYYNLGPYFKFGIVCFPIISTYI
jgi:hypothetical protein